MKIGAIILAAGGSTRLGSPKQLLIYRGDPLLRRAAQAALKVGCDPVIVVLGSSAEHMGASLAGLNVKTVTNPSWQEGMGTSIRLGVATLIDAEAVLLMACDQPMVTANNLKDLLTAFRGSDAIAAASYDGTLGVPAIFSRAHFASLQGLPPETGAKALLLTHRESVIAVDMLNAAIDIDTREQYERLRGDAADFAPSI